MVKSMEARTVRTERRQLTRADRDLMIDNLTEHTVSQKLRIEESPVREELKPYVELVAMMGILRAQDPSIYPESYRGPVLRRQEAAHLRKMIALQARLLPDEARKAPGAEDFWQELELEAEEELARVKALPDDLNGAPRSYRVALVDLGELKRRIPEAEAAISTSRLMQALRASVAARQRAR